MGEEDEGYRVNYARETCRGSSEPVTNMVPAKRYIRLMF